jgi:hypothetical protein
MYLARVIVYYHFIESTVSGLSGSNANIFAWELEGIKRFASELKPIRQSSGSMSD